MKTQHQLLPAEIKRSQGSALLAVLIFAFVLSLMVGSILPLAMTNYRLSFQNHLVSAASYLAEAGADEAILALNTHETVEAWETAGWRLSSDKNFFLKEIDLNSETYQLDGGEEGRIRIIAEVPDGLGSIGVYAEGRITPTKPFLRTVSQVLALEAKIDSPFKGLIAKDSLSFSGKPFFDSYNSTVWPNVYTFGVNSGAAISVGSISSSSGSVNIGNGQVFGDIVSGASDPTGSGAVNMGATSYLSGNVIGDFDQNFPDVKVPNTAGWATSF